MLSLQLSASDLQRLLLQAMAQLQQSGLPNPFGAR